ncbi:MAG: branched-chain amino acid ABC transporter permease [Candidatus Bathyarchaeota archaeon]|nr:MAG: branched-chain amino acid ABC transporter permease [Candidatus Bathyarchaeota archaeon]
METKKLSSPSFYIPTTILALLLFLPLFLWNFGSPFQIHVMIMVCFYAFLGTAWNLVGGYVGQVSIGHSAFYGIGAYVATLAFLEYSISPWLCMFLGAISAAIFAVSIGVPSVRFRGGGAFFALVTIAFAETVRLVFLNLKIGGGAAGVWMPVLPESFLNFQFHSSKVPYYYIIFGFLLAEIFIIHRILKSRWGYYFVAIREDEIKAESVGINTTKYKLIAIFISAFFTAIGGVFYAQYVLYFDPFTVFPLELSVYMVLVATIGGRGTLLGPVVGSFILTPISEYTRVWLGGSFRGLSLTVYGILLMVIVIIIPAGLIVWVKKGYRVILDSLSQSTKHD